MKSVITERYLIFKLIVQAMLAAGLMAIEAFLGWMFVGELGQEEINGAVVGIIGPILGALAPALMVLVTAVARNMMATNGDEKDREE